MAQPVEGYDPKQLEEDGDEVEAAVAAALVTAAAFVAAQVAVAIPGAVTPDMANIVRTIWNQLTARELTPKLADVIRRTADEIRSGIIAVVGPDLPGAVVDQITGVAVPDAPPVPIPTLNDVTAIDILSAASNRMRNIGDVLWQNIRAELVDGLAAGDGIPELADRVRAAAPLTEARARMVARTETIGASNGAAMAQARSTGLQMSKRWLATEDARTRPSHVAADGQTVALNEPFMVGIPVAGPLDFPGDPTGPASEIIQCRCSVLFLISSGANPFVASYGVPHLFTCLPPGDDHAPHPGPCRGWKGTPKAAVPKVSRSKKPGTPNASKPRKRNVAPAKVMTPEQAQNMQDQMLADDPWTPENITALQTYSSYLHSDMNGMLRGQGARNATSGSEEEKRIVESIRQAQDGMRPTTEPVRVFRNTRGDEFGVGFRGDPLSAIQGMIGETRQLRGFTSTSVDPDRANEAQEVGVEIDVPAGTMAAYIAGISRIPIEHELVLAPGTKVTLSGVRLGGPSGNTPIVSLTVVTE